MSNLFSLSSEVYPQSQPLAALMRPENFDDYVGQQHILGEGCALRMMIESGQLSSMILYGPPGTGKTSLARIIAGKVQAHFAELNAVAASTKDIRAVRSDAQTMRDYEQKSTILFVDEVHRFNKAQQDVLMPDVESGLLTFIGATTENPFFAINAPLISRSQIYQFQALSPEDLQKLLGIVCRKLADRGTKLRITEPALKHLADGSVGDARRLINVLDAALRVMNVASDGYYELTEDVLETVWQKAPVVYERDGDEHYDTISAFIKSMRGSDPDATIYWLAKMLYAGEDINFIARRIAICAAEDVGNADPRALLVAQSAWEVAKNVGMPEARIPLAQAASYVATAPKSNAAYKAINAAMSDIQKGQLHAVPTHLKDGSYPGAKQLGHGKGYKYAHDYPGAFVAQEYAPLDKYYYEPTEHGYERHIKERLKECRAKQNSAKKSNSKSNT